MNAVVRVAVDIAAAAADVVAAETVRGHHAKLVTAGICAFNCFAQLENKMILADSCFDKQMRGHTWPS